jgi:histidinol-phosphate/aromatic aminotransferase/cobyric acid decarboxylase-like protein
LWENWIKDFKGCETKKEWAVCNGIHDAITNQVAYKSKTVDTFYIFSTDYKFYPVLLSPYNYKSINPDTIEDIQENSYIVVSQPNHEGKITDWFNPLKDQCRKTNSKILLDCAFYGTTLNDKIDTSDDVFDAVAFSLSKNFLLGGWRVGIIFGDNLAPSLTVPIDHYFNYNYFNIAAVECAKSILPNFKSSYITEIAKPIQLSYCEKNNLIPANIWMWAFDKDNTKICITEYIKNEIQTKLNNRYA